MAKADGTSLRVDALKEGDQIVAAATDGSLTTDTVSLLSIAHPEVIVDNFITLSTAAGASLTLTPNHHLPVGPACCSTLKMAKDVSIGEVVHTVAEGKTTPTKVIGMHVAKATGLHSPVLTNGNFPVVDGFVTSFDSIDKVSLACSLACKPRLQASPASKPRQAHPGQCHASQAHSLAALVAASDL